MEHVLRKPVESRHAYEQRRKTLAFGVVLALSLALALAFVLIGCGNVTSTSGGSAAPPPAVAALSATSFEAPTQIRADQVLISGVRLPYQKSPRNPQINCRNYRGFLANYDLSEVQVQHVRVILRRSDEDRRRTSALNSRAM